MSKNLKSVSIPVFSFLAILFVYFIFKKNFEFLGYTLVTSLIFALILKSDKKYNFPKTALWLFAIWIFMHLLGGSVYIFGTRLYDLILINLFDGGGELVILKYDQAVHAFCYFAISILIYYMLKPHFKNNEKTSLIIFTILSAIGIGMLNEVIEFGMVLFANAADAVGGYFNTALDLVFNLIGAIIGAVFAREVLDNKKLVKRNVSL